MHMIISSWHLIRFFRSPLHVPDHVPDESYVVHGGDVDDEDEDDHRHR